MNMPKEWPTEKMCIAFEWAAEVEISSEQFDKGLRAALEAAPTPPAPEVEPDKPFWPPVQETIDSYLEDYELDDGEIFHSPNELESFLIQDAIAGLLNDDEFMAAYGKWLAAKNLRAELNKK